MAMFIKITEKIYGLWEKHNNSYSWEAGISFLGSSLCSGNLPQNQTYPSSKWREKKKEGEKETNLKALYTNTSYKCYSEDQWHSISPISII